MLTNVGRYKLALMSSLAGAPMICAPAPVVAQSLHQLHQEIVKMRLEVAAQRRLIALQAKRISAQQDQINRLQNGSIAGSALPGGTSTLAQPSLLTPVRAVLPVGANPQTKPSTTQSQVASSATLPVRPVGGSPDLPGVEQQVDPVLEGMGVLTRAGHAVLEPSVEYTNSSNNRLVFRGVELIPGIQVGLIEANNADRNTIVTAGTLRYGLARNLEVEARVPYLFRSDRTQETQQNSAAETLRLNQNGIGDIELGLRYQLNRPIGEKPIFIGTFRVKTDTGKSPYTITFDQNGVAEGLATGSGFWAIQPGINFLLPSDPVVLFGGTSFLYQISRNINRTIGGVLVGRVDPGDAVSANLGFGFALNPRFSFSLGYQHTYIFPTHSNLGGIDSRADGLQVGVFAFGMSYRVSQRHSLNFGLELGATADAPDVSVVLRVPFAR